MCIYIYIYMCVYTYNIYTYTHMYVSIHKIELDILYNQQSDTGSSQKKGIVPKFMLVFMGKIMINHWILGHPFSKTDPDAFETNPNAMTRGQNFETSLVLHLYHTI